MAPPATPPPSSPCDDERTPFYMLQVEEEAGKEENGRFARSWRRFFPCPPAPSLRRFRWHEQPARFTFPARTRLVKPWKFQKVALSLFIGYLMTLGMIQCVSDLANALTTVYPDEMQWVIDHWGTSATELLSHWPTDASGDVRPVACHSHNDEWRAVPLYSAVQAGCTSVEADVFIRDSELLVGHSVSALTPERTLRSLYLDPLLALVENQNPLENYHNHADQLNGIFDTDPKQTLVFMIDFKKDGREIWPVLDDQLSVLRQRGFLTYFNGTDIVERPITVVASGDAPFDLVIANATYRDIFYDAPLAQLADFSSQWKNPVRVPEAEKSANNEFAYDSRIPGMRSPRLEADRATASADEFEESRNRLNMAGKSVYDARNSYYASVSFTKSIGYVWGSRVSQQQLQLIRAQIRGAHQLGLKVRYWGLPYWPTGLRNHVWHILIREGVDVLSVDDLMGAAKRDWRKCKGWFC